MPRHEPETAKRASGPRPDAGFSDANHLAREILEIVHGADSGQIMMALGFVSARLHASIPQSYYDAMDECYRHGFKHGMKY